MKEPVPSVETYFEYFDTFIYYFDIFISFEVVDTMYEVSSEDLLTCLNGTTAKQLRSKKKVVNGNNYLF